jgi:hypothetical protein
MGKRGTCALTSWIRKNICPTSKRAQVTIFIIIAIVIVVGGVLVYAFFPQIKSTLGIGVTNPQTFIFECVEEEIEDAVEKISLHGGDINPTFFSTFDQVKIKNLCYTAEYCSVLFPICSIQEPQLKPHIEREIKNEIEDTVKSCFNSLKESYVRRGYSVDLKEGPIDIELLPNRIVSTFDYDLTLTKEDSEKYDSFSVVLNNNLYELISIANSILAFEATLGGTDVTMYMDLYSNLKVQEKLLSDGTKIYIITDRKREDKFQFASRSRVLSGAGFC